MGAPAPFSRVRMRAYVRAVKLYNIFIYTLGNIRDIAGGFRFQARLGRSLMLRQAAS